MAALTHRPPEQGGIPSGERYSHCSRTGDGKTLQHGKEGDWMPAETQTSAKAWSVKCDHCGKETHST